MNIRELALAVLGQTELVEPTATNAENYFTYDGSFTTAPCTQVKPLASTPEPQTPRSSHRALPPPPPPHFRQAYTHSLRCVFVLDVWESPCFGSFGCFGSLGHFELDCWLLIAVLLFSRQEF